MGARLLLCRATLLPVTFGHATRCSVDGVQETVGTPKLLGVTTVPIIPFCFHLQPGTPPVVRSHDGAHGLCLRALPTLRLARKLSDFAPLRPLQRNLRSFRNEKKQPVLGYSHSQFPNHQSGGRTAAELRWCRMFGSAGAIQAQVVLPLRSLLAEFSVGPALCVQCELPGR